MRHLFAKLALSTAILAGGAMAIQACPMTTASDTGLTGKIQLAQAGGGGGSSAAVAAPAAELAALQPVVAAARPRAAAAAAA